MKFINTLFLGVWHYILDLFSFKSKSSSGPKYEHRELKPLAKLSSLTYQDLVSKWIQIDYGDQHLIVLFNINVSAKNIRFWAKVPKQDMPHFLNDIVILRCKDKSEMLRLIENIDTNFAEAVGYSSGVVVATNMESVE